MKVSSSCAAGCCFCSDRLCRTVCVLLWNCSSGRDYVFLSLRAHRGRRYTEYILYMFYVLLLSPPARNVFLFLCCYKKKNPPTLRLLNWGEIKFSGYSSEEALMLFIWPFQCLFEVFNSIGERPIYGNIVEILIVQIFTSHHSSCTFTSNIPTLKMSWRRCQCAVTLSETLLLLWTHV